MADTRKSPPPPPPPRPEMVQKQVEILRQIGASEYVIRIVESTSTGPLPGKK